MKKEKIKDVKIEKIDNIGYILKFFSNGYDVKIEADEAVCYRLYREIKKHLNLK